MRRISRIAPLVSLILALGCSKHTSSDGPPAPTSAADANDSATASVESPTAVPPETPATAPVGSAAVPAPSAGAVAVELPAKCGNGPNVDFHGDARLETAIRTTLGAQGGPIARTDLAHIGFLDLTPIKLDQLDPCIFPLMTGMKALFLPSSTVLSDLRPLSTLVDMRILQAARNQVSDVTPLASMIHMDRLDLEGTKVHDLSPLANMTVLAELNLDSTPLKDLSPLAHCTKLKRVNLRDTAVTDVSPLESAKGIRAIDVQGSPVVTAPFALRTLVFGRGPQSP